MKENERLGKANSCNLQRVIHNDAMATGTFLSHPWISTHVEPGKISTSTFYALRTDELCTLGAVKTEWYFTGGRR